jgi:hypothetical protein
MDEQNRQTDAGLCDEIKKSARANMFTHPPSSHNSSRAEKPTSCGAVISSDDALPQKHVSAIPFTSHDVASGAMPTTSPPYSPLMHVELSQLHPVEESVCLFFIPTQTENMRV